MGMVYRIAVCPSCKTAGNWKERLEDRRIDKNFIKQIRVITCDDCGSSWEQPVRADEKIYLPENV